MNDLRKAAEMALEALCLTNNEAVPDDIEERREAAIEALRQALAQEEKPPVKSYCGGKPNYCTPEETFTLDRGCWERGCVAYDERDGDGVNILGKRVDETAKGEQEPVAWRTFDGEGGYDYRSYEANEYYDKEWAERNPNHTHWVEPLYTAPPKKEWVGLDGEIPGLGLVTEEFYNGMLFAEDILREKNGG